MQNISVIYLAAGQSANALAYSDSVFCELTGRSHLPQDGSWVGKLPFSYNTSLYIRHRMKLLQGRAVLQLADRYTQYIATHLPAFRTQATLKDLSAVHKHLYATAIETCWELGLPEKALGYSEQSKALLLRLAANNLLADAGGSSDPVTERDHQFRKRIGELNARYLNEGGDSVLHLLTGAIEQYRIFQDSIRTSGNTALAARYRLEPYSLQDIRSKLLRHGETLLEYTVTGEWVFLFVVNDKVCRMQRIPRKALADIHTLRQLSGLSPEAFAAPAFHLYNALVQPAVAHVNRKRLLVVPDGELFYLNFELLLSRNNAARFADMPYLVRDYNISYLLSATSAIQLNEGHTGRANDKALLFTPVFTDEMKDLYRQRNTSEQEYLYLHRQPFALEAARQIGRIVPNDLYAEQQAQEQTFKQAAPGYRVLHLGTHAALNDAAQLHSRLYFAQAAPGDSANTEDGYLHAYEIYAMQLHADLAVLTACETGAGALQEGEGILSLSHSFMYAGCKSVIMSGWKIDEKTSMKVITGCYDYLSKGYTKSEALRKAKLDLLDSDPRLAHPYYWAGLTLIGDDSVVYKRPYTLFWLAGGVLLLLAAGGWYWRKSSAYRA
ncbi:CHAT domain-containing protein [Chitinophaga sedimenti]|uniref:CHAT domain-containing protein n=1 Tax=Chitinophaga sedimenti TaxID=2033606 RepID=UPI002005758A|nr:CHAT domain-containing protein [Chitinophaga sedimenti]MCK7554722.1 CHAT domain-containing protein [Chitinophaga sedimenti]